MDLFVEENTESITFTAIRHTIELTENYILKIGLVNECRGIVVVLKQLDWSEDEMLFTKTEFLKILHIFKAFLNDASAKTPDIKLDNNKHVWYDYFGCDYSLYFYSPFPCICLFDNEILAFFLNIDHFHDILVNLEEAQPS